KTANQQAVLNGWLNELGQRLGKTYAAADFEGAIYQMLHRAASAAFAGEQPRLAYFVFKEPSPDPRAATPDDIFQRLTSLWKLLGTPGSPVSISRGCVPACRLFTCRNVNSGAESSNAAHTASAVASSPFGSDRRARQASEGSSSI